MSNFEPKNKIFMSIPGGGAGLHIWYPMLNKILENEYGYQLRVPILERLQTTFYQKRYIDELVNFKIGEYMLNHYEYIKEIHNYDKKSDFKLVLVVRDLRDMIVCSLNRDFFVNNVPTWVKKEPGRFLGFKNDNDPFQQKKYLKKYNDVWIKYDSFEEHIKFETPIVAKLLKKVYSDWLKVKEIYLIKFEDMKANQISVMKNLFKYFELPISQEKIIEYLYNHDFKRYSEGRKEGQEKKGAMYRRGISGEWKTVFDQKQKEYLKDELGELLIKLGYENNYNWEN